MAATEDMEEIKRSLKLYVREADKVNIPTGAFAQTCK